MLDVLERRLPDAALFLAHLDRGEFVHRIVDTRNGAALGLRSNLATPLGDAFCSHMADYRAPRLCNEVARHPVYSSLPMQEHVGARAVPRQRDGARTNAAHPREDERDPARAALDAPRVVGVVDVRRLPERLLDVRREPGGRRRGQKQRERHHHGTVHGACILPRRAVDQAADLHLTTPANAGTAGTSNFEEVS